MGRGLLTGPSLVYEYMMSRQSIVIEATKVGS